MQRRTAIRRAAILAAGMVMGKFDIAKAQPALHGKAELHVPLDQWSRVVFERKGKSVIVPVDEIFEALQ